MPECLFLAAAKRLLSAPCPHVWLFKDTQLESFGMGLEWCHNYQCRVCGDWGNYPKDYRSAPRWFFGVVGRNFDFVNSGPPKPPDAATKVALAKAAAADKRSLSAMVENYIVERLRADGWLKAEKGKRG